METEIKVKEPETQLRVGQALCTTGRLAGLKEPGSSPSMAAERVRCPRTRIKIGSLECPAKQPYCDQMLWRAIKA